MAQNDRTCADIILDGVITELKKIEGSRETLGTRFRLGYKQGKSLLKEHPEIKEHSVFIWLLSDLSVVSVKAKVAGELKKRTDAGAFICYFDTSAELYKWTYDELRAFIRPEKK